MDEQSKKIMLQLQNLCARQECCSKDLYTKALRRLKAAEGGSVLKPSTADDICFPQPGSHEGSSSFTQGGSVEQRTSAIVEALIADGYANDLRYAGAFVREKSAITGWGPHKIRMALRAKGIADDLISQALETVEPDKADAKLERLLLNKSRSLEGDPQARLKLIRYALSRGYDWDSVNSILQKLG